MYWVVYGGGGGFFRGEEGSFFRSISFFFSGLSFLPFEIQSLTLWSRFLLGPPPSSLSCSYMFEVWVNDILQQFVRHTTETFF